jgi:hypothetical protein
MMLRFVEFRVGKLREIQQSKALPDVPKMFRYNMYMKPGNILDLMQVLHIKI